jgi:hypothetical protein
MYPSSIVCIRLRPWVYNFIFLYDHSYPATFHADVGLYLVCAYLGSGFSPKVGSFFLLLLFHIVHDGWKLIYEPGKLTARDAKLDVSRRANGGVILQKQKGDFSANELYTTYF